MTRVFAAADIGSNTAHLLVAESGGELVTRIDNFNEWIPLGEVVSRHQKIPKELVSQLVSAVRESRRIAISRQAEFLYIFATEGMRMAENHDAVLRKIKAETGVNVELISAIREAELSFKGVQLDTKHHDCGLMFEVGGGSVQVGVIERNALGVVESLRMGTGKVVAVSGVQNPCPEYAFAAAENFIASVLEESKIQVSAKRAVASGGVGRGLWRSLHPDSEKVLTIEEIDYIIWATNRLTPDRIVARFDVKAKRAGTLLPGALVYRALMRKFGVSEIVVSEFGIREGAVLEMAGGKIEGTKL